MFLNLNKNNIIQKLYHILIKFKFVSVDVDENPDSTEKYINNARLKIHLFYGTKLIIVCKSSSPKYL